MKLRPNEPVKFKQSTEIGPHEFLSFHSNWTPRPAYSTGIAYAAFPSSRLNGFYFTNGIQYLKIIFLA